MNDNFVLEKLDRLRIDLVELAFSLECRGRLDAADVAMTTSARVGELCEELLATAGAVIHTAPQPAPSRERVCRCKQQQVDWSR